MNKNMSVTRYSFITSTNLDRFRNSFTVGLSNQQYLAIQESRAAARKPRDAASVLFG